MSHAAPERSRRRPLLIALSAALVIALVVTGFVLWQRRGDGTEEAEAFVAALAAGDLSGAPLADVDAAAETDERILGPLREASEAEPEVELADPGRVDDGSREITLRWSWQLPGIEEPWTYETTAEVRRGSDGWQVQYGPQVYEESLGEREHLEFRRLEPEVGTITDSGGTELFGPREVRVIGLDKPEIDEGDQESAARKLAEALDIDADTYVQTVESYGEEAFVPALTVRPENLGNYPLEEAEKIGGYRVVEETQPLAASRDYAPGVLGSLREASAEDVESSDGEIVEGDLVGTGGVAAAKRDQIVGAAGGAVLAVDPDAEEEREVHKVDAEDGGEVRTTLDDDLQQISKDVLADTDAPSAAVAIRPSTGDVLASAVGPKGQEFPLGLEGQYPPGSTFKTVTALSLLREGDTPDTELECPERATIDGQQFKNADSLSPDLYGTMTLAQVIAQSCNTALLEQHDRVEQSELADAATTLGVGQEPGPGLDAFMGSIDPEDEGTQHAAAMMGQGRVLSSPLSMATVLGSVVAGETVRPRILADEDAPAEEVDNPLTDQETEQLQGMLRGVVTDGGLDDFADAPGDPVIGKTGTAEWVNEDGDLKLHSWVIVAQGDLALAVFVEDGSYGSVTAGPLARDILVGYHERD